MIENENHIDVPPTIDNVTGCLTNIRIRDCATIENNIVTFNSMSSSRICRYLPITMIDYVDHDVPSVIDASIEH